jgi:16S rRNA (uracil1498-N3)-methyltransferase
LVEVVEIKKKKAFTKILSSRPFHHIFDVCRQNVGSQFEVLVGDGKAYLVEVVEIKKKKAFTKILSSRPLEIPAGPNLHLFLSLSKWAVMDAVVEKSVELGVKSFTPVICRNSFLNKIGEVSEARLARWRKIVLSATQQSGRGDLMEIKPAQDLSGTLASINQMPAKACLFLYEGPSQTTVRQWASSCPSSATNIALLVGSEGGFSPEEAQQIQGVGFAPVTLGTQVLRVETACVVGLSVLKYSISE